MSIISIQFTLDFPLNSSFSVAMNNDHGEGKVYCVLHPEEMVVGVCAHCLKERLLALASKQGQHPCVPKKATKYSSTTTRRKHIVKIPKVFALARPLLYRLDLQYQRSKDDCEDESSVGSNEGNLPLYSSFQLKQYIKRARICMIDSFISVKFDDDGCASWDTIGSIPTGSSTVTNITSESNRNKHMVVAKTKKSSIFKWKKRLRQLLQLRQ